MHTHTHTHKHTSNEEKERWVWKAQVTRDFGLWETNKKRLHFLLFLTFAFGQSKEETKKANIKGNTKANSKVCTGMKI